jgi:Periplasmic binding protein
VRICSLLPSATEIVASLGLTDLLIARSQECDWPPEVHQLPIVTASRVDTSQLSSLNIEQAVRHAISDGRPLYAIDAELLDALKPDMILTQNLCSVCAISADNVGELCATDAQVIAVDAHTLDEIKSGILDLASLLGAHERGRAVVEQMNATIDAVRKQVDGGARAAGVRRRMARPTLRRRPLDPRDGRLRRRPRRTRTSRSTLLPNIMADRARATTRTDHRRPLRVRPRTRRPRSIPTAARLPHRRRRLQRPTTPDPPHVSPTASPNSPSSSTLT